MAELKKTTNDHRRKSSRFLCCFGFPEKEPQLKKKTTTVGSDHDRRRNKITLRLSLSALRVKNNRTSIKTVPVLLDGTSAEPDKPQRAEIKTIHYWLKPKSKSKSKSTYDDDDQKLMIKSIMISPEKPHDQVAPPTTKNNQPPRKAPTVVPSAPDQNPKEIRPLEKTNLENRKSSVQLSSSKDDTCQKRLSFTRKIDAIRTGSSQPGSPLNSKPVRTIRHSESFPGPTNREKPRLAANKPAVWEREPARIGRRFEPLVGMSVVMVTLVIMLLWGRLFAILCTSAWLYFVPRLSSAVVDPTIEGLGSGSGSGRLDLGSEECKKKVVFEGFLERNNHRTSL